MIVTLGKNNVVVAISLEDATTLQLGSSNDPMMDARFPEILQDGTQSNLNSYRAEVVDYTYLNGALDSYKNNQEIGYTYDNNLNAFVPPQPDPTYILDQDNIVWNPNPELTYDIHNDGVLYKWGNIGWTLV